MRPSTKGFRVSILPIVSILLILIRFFSLASAQLPPEILADRYLLQAGQLYAVEDNAAAFELMQKIIALQKEHKFSLPDEFHYKYARVAISVDSVRIALDSVNRYLSLTGRDGEYYKQALALSLEAEWPEISAEETCAGKPAGVACWNELTSHPKCYVWEENYDEDWTVTWSGKCSGNVAHGKGTLMVSKGDYEFSDSGILAKGKKHGNWVGHDSYGGGSEGPYVANKKHGHWVWRDSRGGGSEGPYVDGKKRGHWVLRDSRGGGSEGPYVDGEKHGHWILRTRSGAAMQGSFVAGREQGVWYGETEICAHSEGVSKKITVRGKYVDGQKRGYWQNGELSNVNFDSKPWTWVGSGHYDTNGLRTGTWTYRRFDCSGQVGAYSIGRNKGDYVEGKKDGTWFYYTLRNEEGSTWSACIRSTYDHGNRMENKNVKLKKCRRMDW